MAFVAIADRDHEHALHDPETFIRKYIWSQDHKVIAVQYTLTAMAIGLVALAMSVMMRMVRAQPLAEIAQQRFSHAVRPVGAGYEARGRADQDEARRIRGAPARNLQCEQAAERPAQQQ